jgi:hypothetical protein
MSALNLADIEQERNKLLSRQADNEKSWNEFRASPAVPLAQQPLGTTIDAWTEKRRRMYEGTKADIARNLERLREQEARLRSSLEAEPVPAPVAHQHTDFPSAELIVKLNDPNYGLFDRPDIKDLIKFYIYYYNAVKYPKKGTFAQQVDAQVIHTKRLLDRIKSGNFMQDAHGRVGKAEYIVTHFIHTRTDGVANPDDHTIDAMYQMYENIYGQDGGHKSARRGKSKSKSKCRYMFKSKSKCKSKCKSKSKCRG